jgi:hypothetical protein
MNNFSEIIMLRYPLDGEIQSGVIMLNFGFNSHKTEGDYLGIEYSDKEIQSYVEGNPAVLSRIESLRYKRKV